MRTSIPSSHSILAWFALSFCLLFFPTGVYACACGCGVFDVGTGTMLPNGIGGNVWLEFDYMDQNRNWSGSSKSSPANNSDKELVSDFLVAGGQYMFSRAWGAEIDVPYTNRFFNTTDDQGMTATFHHGALGDVRIKGIYAGLSDDMSTGLTYGLKLPTGDYAYHGFDRDTATGTGSTDWLLGAYHQGVISQAAKLDWFANGQWDHAFTMSSHYRPGDEWDGALGSYYSVGEVVGGDALAPLLQVIGSYRHHDDGFNAAPEGSGYRRLMLSPGVEYDVADVKLYADVEVPVYQSVNGNQLVAPIYTKFVVGYSF